ncbi:hypothetical protein FBZ83_11645 [Azospirillum brasilense]|uniref:Uncharacterized protein n=1 Tax=Azospirillum brasilense TaxID=192 RepID=A0A560BWR7_AZOBR|nr:hypothetical protein [Azospirillum brasilense]MBK3732718.1 hypothetical protein [Azospirillum brasilense]TWA77053.1 hypothetical protein FBZ83_11645 [Azospirillum brasilense]
MFAGSGCSAAIANHMAVDHSQNGGLRPPAFNDGATPLRRSGNLNLSIANDQYGSVKITHLSLLHAMPDLAMGWTAVDVEAVV